MKHSWVEVDLGILEENIRNVRKALRRSEIMFVVKANAYGHGLVPVAERAGKAGIRWFAVAYLDEALAVRKAVAGADILVLGAVEASDLPVLLEQRITPVIVSERHGMGLAEAAHRLGAKLPVHLKIDTGMGRLGLPWAEAGAIHERLGTSGGLEIRGICTHFAAVKPTNLESAQAQHDRFAAAAKAAEELEGRRLFKHVASSRAFLYVKDWDFDGVRLGISLYGYGARSSHVRVRTRPILQWKSRVVQVKSVPAQFPIGYFSTYVTPAPTDIATISVGYADGYPRLLSNKGHVLIGGRRCAIVGRVSMNWVTVDVGPDSAVREGDEVVLIGEQGKEAIWADELAVLCQTIPYEILTDINAELERKYSP
ncbi:MAG: alanine racemase [Verrucomicrobiota bacterium]